MKYIKLFKRKKFLGRIQYGIVAIFSLSLIIFSLVTYYYIRNVFIENEFSNNQKLLNQISHNIENVDESITSLCLQLLSEPDVFNLMYQNSNTVDNILNIKKLQKRIIPYPFIKSVGIYDFRSDVLYSTSAGIRENIGLFDRVIEENGTLPILRPFISEMPVAIGTDVSEISFVYCLYDAYYHGTLPISSLFVEIDLSWFTESIKQITITDTYDNIYILNENGELIAGTGGVAFSESIQNIAREFLENKNEIVGYVNRTLDGASQIVTYLNIASIGIVLLKTQLYDSFFSILGIIFTNILFITAVFIVIGLLPSYMVSKRIYKPLANLISKMRMEKSANKNETTDEIAYISETIDTLIGSSNKTTAILPSAQKDYHLKNLLTSSFDDETIIKLFEHKDIAFKADSGFYVCLIMIDRYKEFDKVNDIQSKNIYKYAIINITCEVLSASYRVEGVDTGNDKIAVIINTKKMEDSIYPDLKKLFKRSQEYVNEYFNISFSVAFSGYGENISALSALYVSAIKSSQYRLVYGEGSIITPVMIDKRYDYFFREYSSDFEKKFSESIKSNNSDKIKHLLGVLSKEITKLSYTDVIVAMIKTLSIFEDVVIDLNKISIKPIYIDFAFLRSGIFEIETCDEFFSVIERQLDILCKSREGNDLSVKHSYVAESAKAVIDLNYSDNMLCLQSISERIKISSGYLSQIFKGAYGVSIGEYINEVRLKKVVELLESTELNISEILSQVGIQNQTYFYRLFKKKYGASPKEFRRSLTENIHNS